MDYTEARRWMVDGQLRPSRVTDPRILSAMMDLPRERFVPAAALARAYADRDIALPRGRAIMKPMVLARLVQLLGLRPGDRALVVGPGTGYGTAVAARTGAHVTAVEEDPELAAAATSALAETVGAAAVKVVQGPLIQGWPGAAPYDAILIEGAVPQVPEAISAQLVEGGRLATVIAEAGRAPRAVLGRRVGGTFSLTDAFDAAATPIPAFAPEPGFVL